MRNSTDQLKEDIMHLPNSASSVCRKLYRDYSCLTCVDNIQTDEIKLTQPRKKTNENQALIIKISVNLLNC